MQKIFISIGFFLGNTESFRQVFLCKFRQCEPSLNPIRELIDDSIPVVQLLFIRLLHLLHAYGNAPLILLLFLNECSHDAC
jgi:hypothetical protein